MKLFKSSSVDHSFTLKHFLKSSSTPFFVKTLAECTKSMDAVTWNTYQIVSNRARAMCYATQQLQFRRLTEKSVNQLAAATSVQLQAMKELKVSVVL